MVRSGYAVTFNGEIYNYIELRQELQVLGWKFTSESDTEVLLTAFREWGIDCLSRLRGMFAFAIVDIDADAIFLVRDRFGVKPLFWSPTQDGVLVSSTPQSLAEVLPPPSQIGVRCSRH